MKSSVFRARQSSMATSHCMACTSPNHLMHRVQSPANRNSGVVLNSSAIPIKYSKRQHIRPHNSLKDPFQVADQLAVKSSNWAATSSTTTATPAYTEHAWKWREYNVKYATAGCGRPVLLIHGFGASIGHWRKNISELAKNGCKVYAIDLLGLGGSDKPEIQYSMELWRDQIVDFVTEFIPDKGVVLVGNSIGSLACLMSNVALPAGKVSGTVLLNSAGAMNNKGIVSGDWRILLVYPVLLLIDALLNNKTTANYLFNKFRTRDNITKVLQSVYCNKAAVDDELLDIILTPSDDPGALHVFASVITGPPGPKPWELMPSVQGPLLVLWGDTDPFTPLNGPVGQYMKALPDTRELTTFQILEDVGHCPHDDRPEEVHKYLLPWLAALSTEPVPASTQ